MRRIKCVDEETRTGVDDAEMERKRGETKVRVLHLVHDARKTITTKESKEGYRPKAVSELEFVVFQLHHHLESLPFSNSLPLILKKTCFSVSSSMAWQRWLSGLIFVTPEFVQSRKSVSVSERINTLHKTVNMRRQYGLGCAVSKWAILNEPCRCTDSM